MKKQPKRPKLVHRETREILSANVVRLLEKRFPDAPDRVEALHKRSTLSRSTIQRARDASHGISVDSLGHMAMALGCEPHELLRRPNKAEGQAT